MITEREMIIMKKVLYILAAIIVLFTLSGCGIIDKLFYKEPPTQETSESTSASTTTTSTTTPITTPSTTTTTTSAPTEESEEMTKVWAKQDVNVREKSSTDSKKLGVLHEGNSVIRIAKTSDGWSKIIFNDIEAYISTSYLTETEPTRATYSDRVIVDPDSDLWYFVIVNTERAIPSDYVPKLAEVAGSGIYMDYRVAPYYNEMYAAAKKDGVILTPYSGYRSYARQQRNYNNLTSKYMSQYHLTREEAAAKAATVILPPGTSEHHLGLAMDICNTNSSFSSQKEYKWLTEHAHEYGFILRYTAEKQDITGIIPEPWHWRYVGVEHAKAIKDSGLCLEEYIQVNGISA